MDITELVASYNKCTKEYFRQLEVSPSKKCNKKEVPKPKAPNFIEDVIVPIFQALAEQMPRRKVRIPDKDYSLTKGSYKIKIGATTVGGFLFADDDTSKLFYTQMFRRKPIGELIEITSTKQLAQLIINQIKNDKEENSK